MSAISVSLPESAATQPRGLRFFPCQRTKGQQIPIVLVHGWGGDSQIWQTIPLVLSEYIDVYTLDLPGFGSSASLNSYSEQDLLNWLHSQLPSSCYLVGLSLGGMLCRAYAAQYPAAVLGVVTIATNSRFVADKQYAQAMPKADFKQFAALWNQDPHSCLKRFKILQAQGDQQQRKLIAQLRKLNFKMQVSAATALLNLLATMDGSKHIEGIKCPSLAIFGSEDCLVPPAAADVLPHHYRRVIIPQASHLPHLTAQSQVVRQVQVFIDQQQNGVDKSRVAKSFGAAAAKYDTAATIQNWSGQQLIKRIANTPLPDSILDLGCGTGAHTTQLKTLFPNATVMGMDIAPQMLNYARHKNGNKNIPWLCGDAENLSLQDLSQSVIFSNFALQWCNNLNHLSAEIFRILKPGGRFYFALPGARTLYELRDAWEQVDTEPRINHFFTTDQWRLSLQSCGFEKIELDQTTKIEHFPSVRDLMKTIKAVGANIQKGDKPKPFVGRSQFDRMYKAYEKYRTEQGEIPATWDIIYGVVVK
jgi:malonyl-CoA O-methyltransferase